MSNMYFVASFMVISLAQIQGIESTGTVVVNIVEFSSQTESGIDIFFNSCFKPTPGASCGGLYTQYFPLDQLDQVGFPGFTYDVATLPTSFGVLVEIGEPTGWMAGQFDLRRALGVVNSSVPVTIGISTTVVKTTNGNHAITITTRCECDDNYYGADCSVYCAPQDDTISGHYSCDQDGSPVCEVGFESSTDTTPCVVDIDECSPNPCLNGGVCTEGDPETFFCTCSSNWAGNFCQDPVMTVHLPDIAKGNKKDDNRHQVMELLGTILANCLDIEVLPGPKVAPQGDVQIACYNSVIDGVGNRLIRP